MSIRTYLYTLFLFFITVNSFAISITADQKKCVEILRGTPLNEMKTFIREGQSYIKKIPIKECLYFNKIKKKVPKESHDALKQALNYRVKYKEKFTQNPRYISFADYSVNSRKKRFYMIDLYSGEVTAEKVSHGRNSDNGKHNGIMSRCKKRGKRTNATRPGFFKIKAAYVSRGSCKLKKKNGKPSSYAKMLKIYGRPKNSLCAHGEFKNSKGRLKWGWPKLGDGFRPGQNALRMAGLSKGVNHLAQIKGVVMHGAAYNQADVMGRSYGCPAFHPDVFNKIATRLQKGSLYYSYTPQCKDDLKKVLKDIPNWENICN